MRRCAQYRSGLAFAAILPVTLSLTLSSAMAQDSTGARRVSLRTFSIEAPPGEDWKTAAFPEKDSVAFYLEIEATLGLFGTNQFSSVEAVRVDGRYTVQGEMMSKEEYLEFYRSAYLSYFRKLLPRGVLSTMSPSDSGSWGGKEFFGVKVWNTLERGSSEGRMYIYFPADYAARKASYRFELAQAASASLLTLGPESFSFEDMLTSFRPTPPLQSYMNGDGRLAVAAAGGDSLHVRALVETGANVNVSTGEGTPLTLASRGGHLPIVQYLLTKGASQDPKVCGGQDTPLHAAIDGRAMDVASHLLERGADVNAVVKGSWTPLMQAVCVRADTSFLQLLLKKGAKIDAMTNDSTTALFMAAHIGSADVAGFLLDHGATTALKTADDWSPFLEAVRQGHMPVVKTMLGKGADPNEHRVNGWSALMAASMRGYMDIVSMLLEKGARLNAAHLLFISEEATGECLTHRPPAAHAQTHCSRYARKDGWAFSPSILSRV